MDFSKPNVKKYFGKNWDLAKKITKMKNFAEKLTLLQGFLMLKLTNFNFGLILIKMDL